MSMLCLGTTQIFKEPLTQIRLCSFHKSQLDQSVIFYNCLMSPKDMLPANSINPFM